MADESLKHLTDAYAPAEIARRVLDVGVAKARLPVPDSLALAVLAGAFIALGAAFATLATTSTGLGFGPTRLLGGIVFSLGLILVVVAGAELFTGNNLVAMASRGRRVLVRVSTTLPGGVGRGVILEGRADHA
jgi:formate transporter